MLHDYRLKADKFEIYFVLNNDSFTEVKMNQVRLYLRPFLIRLPRATFPAIPNCSSSLLNFKPILISIWLLMMKAKDTTSFDVNPPVFRDKSLTSSVHYQRCCLSPPHNLALTSEFASTLPSKNFRSSFPQLIFWTFPLPFLGNSSPTPSQKTWTGALCFPNL